MRLGHEPCLANFLSGQAGRHHRHEIGKSVKVIDGDQSPPATVFDDHRKRGSVSDMSQGPGWWIASDGKWYPPQSHPDAVAAAAAAAAEPEPEPEPEPDVASAPPAEPSPTPLPSRTTGRGRSKMPWVLGAIAVAALAVAALVVALTSGSGSSSPTGGGGTIPFQFSLDQAGSSSFSGAVGGEALTGAARTDEPTLPSAGASSLLSPVFTYRGALGGTAYVLHVTLNTPTQVNSPNEQIAFGVTGTYGSEPVTASARFKVASVNASTATVSFNGYVGSEPITGVATATHVADGKTTITGTVNAVPTG